MVLAGVARASRARCRIRLGGWCWRALPGRPGRCRRLRGGRGISLLNLTGRGVNRSGMESPLLPRGSYQVLSSIRRPPRPREKSMAGSLPCNYTAETTQGTGARTLVAKGLPGRYPRKYPRNLYRIESASLPATGSDKIDASSCKITVRGSGAGATRSTGSCDSSHAGNQSFPQVFTRTPSPRTLPFPVGCTTRIPYRPRPDARSSVPPLRLLQRGTVEPLPTRPAFESSRSVEWDQSPR